MVPASVEPYQSDFETGSAACILNGHDQVQGHCTVKAIDAVDSDEEPH